MDIFLDLQYGNFKISSFNRLLNSSDVNGQQHLVWLLYTGILAFCQLGFLTPAYNIYKIIDKEFI